MGFGRIIFGRSYQSYADCTLNIAVENETELFDVGVGCGERENERLRQDISILGTPESVERIAQSELDMVKPGTVLFQPEE